MYRAMLHIPELPTFALSLLVLIEFAQEWSSPFISSISTKNDPPLKMYPKTRGDENRYGDVAMS